ncbi:MAG: nucleotidyltransferase family protein [Planctomycetota bacterium]|jgi:hypothetical protein
MVLLKPPIDTTSPPDAHLVRAVLSGEGPDRLAPFVHSLTSRAQSTLSGLQRQRLERAYRTTLLRNLVLHRETEAVLTAFRTRSVPVIPLNGTWLAWRLYGDLGLRPGTTIDLFVRSRDLPAARETLQTLTDLLAPAEDATRGPRSSVSLHDELLGGWCRAERLSEDVWRRASVQAVNGFISWQMAPTDELLLLCLNLARHLLADASPVPDLVLALDVHRALELWQDAIDWGVLLERSRRYGQSFSVALALAFTEEWFGVRLPPRAARALAMPAWQRRMIDLGTRPGGGAMGRRPLRLLTATLVLTARWRDRLGHR